MNQPIKQPKRENRAIWAKRYQQWQESGLSKAKYCREHGINTACFYFWCGVFRKEPPLANTHKASARVAKPTFIPVILQDPAPMLTLQCGDITLRCTGGVSGEQLTQWIVALRNATCSQ